MSGLKRGLLPRYTSIIVTTYISDELRAKMFRTSLAALLETTKGLPVEIIIVDNGGDDQISKTLLELTRNNMIHCYIKNSSNLSFGFGRNQGLAAAKGNYIVIADNDILYKKGWLEACWKPLELYPDRKIYSTPIEYPTGFYKERYDQGKLDVDGVEYNLNMRAGSNCFMVRRKDFEIIGGFWVHRIAGSRWTDRAVKLKYLAAVAPGELVSDLGLRMGYVHSEFPPLGRKLVNGEKVYFNVDEFKTNNPELPYA